MIVRTGNAILRYTLAALMCGLVLTAHARDVGQDEALRLRRGGALLPFATIQDIALKRYPGATLLEVELEAEDDRYIYELELLIDGSRVRELEIDGGSGAVLHDEAED